MGAARLGQAASDAVIVTVRRPLTWAKAVTLAVWLAVHCVVVLAVAGSRPVAMRIRRDQPCRAVKPFEPSDTPGRLTFCRFTGSSLLGGSHFRGCGRGKKGPSNPPRQVFEYSVRLGALRRLLCRQTSPCHPGLGYRRDFAA